MAQVRSPRFEALDALRGVCACMVALFHFHAAGVIGGSAVVRHGPLFVDFFFVLSGFVIAASYGDRLGQGFSIARFMGLRLGRIYPLHLAMLLLFAVYEALFALAAPGGSRAAFTGAYDAASFGTNLLLVHIFASPPGSWNQPSWSIAAEYWTYLIFALLFARGGRAFVPLCLVIASAACLVLASAPPLYILQVAGLGLVRCIYGFALGAMGWRLFRRAEPRGRASKGAATVAEIVAVAAVLAFVAHADGRIGLFAPPIFLMLVLIFARQAGAVSRLLLTAPCLLLGSLSYSIYMLHYFVQLRLLTGLAVLTRISHGRLMLAARTEEGTHLTAGPIAGDLLSVAMLALVISLAWVSWRLVERPGQRWSRRLLLGDHPRPTTIAAEADAPTF